MSLVIIFEASPKDASGNPVTFRMCSATGRSDAVNLDGKEWKPAILAGPKFSYSLWGSDFEQPQPLDVSYGQIDFQLAREFGNMDCTNYVWSGANGSVWVGKPGEPWSSYRRIWTGTLGPIARADDRTASVSLLGPEAQLTGDLLSASYQGTGNAEGPSSMLGRLKPFAIGDLTNVEGTIIDPIYFIYQVDGYDACQINAVYSNALILKAAKNKGNAANYAALKAMTLVPGEWATCHAQGLYRLGGDPGGAKITADVGTPATTGQVLTALFAAAGVTGGSLNASITGATGPARFYSADQVTIADALRKVAIEAGRYLVPNSSGVWHLASHLSSTTPTALTGDRSTQPFARPDTVRQEVPARPVYRVKVGHTRVWAVHSNSEVSEAVATLGADLTAANAAAADALAKANAAGADGAYARQRVENQIKDTVLDRTEKLALIADVRAYTAEKNGLISTGNGQGNTAEVNTYSNAYNALIGYLNGLNPSYTDLNSDTPITSALANYTDNYTDARNALTLANLVKASKTANWPTIYGDGKPADYATVGARLGTNFFSSGGTSLGDANVITNQGTAAFVNNQGTGATASSIYGLNAGEGAKFDSIQYGASADTRILNMGVGAAPSINGNTVQKTDSNTGFNINGDGGSTAAIVMAGMAGAIRVSARHVTNGQVSQLSLNNGGSYRVNDQIIGIRIFADNSARVFTGSTDRGQIAPYTDGNTIYGLEYDGVQLKVLLDGQVKMVFPYSPDITMYAAMHIATQGGGYREVSVLTGARAPRLNNFAYDEAGILLTDNIVKTSLGTARYLQGQGSLATLSSIGYGSSYLTGFGSFAGLSSAAYGSSYLTGFGALAPLGSIAFGSNYLLESVGGALASLANFRTDQGTARYLFNQAATATSSDWSVITGNGKPDYGATLGDNLVLNANLLNDVSNWTVGSGMARVAPGSGDPAAFFRSTVNNASVRQIYLPIPAGARKLYLSYYRRHSASGKQTNIGIEFTTADNNYGGGYALNNFDSVAGAWGLVTHSFDVPANVAKFTVSAQGVIESGQYCDFALIRVALTEGGATIGSTLGSNFRSSGGVLLNDAGVITDQGTARYLFNQAATATNSDFSAITGSSKPANNATVGARSGLNFLSSSGGLFYDADIQTSQGTARYLFSQSPWATSSISTGRVGRLFDDGTARIGNGGFLLNEAGNSWLNDANIITSNGTAAYLNGQGALATQNSAAFGSQISGLPYAIAPAQFEQGNYLKASSIVLPNVAFLSDRWPQEGNANITESRTSRYLYGQSPFATSTDYAYMTGVTAPKPYAGQVIDNRGDNQPPSYYYALGLGERQEFKDGGFGGSGSSGYGHCLTVTQWGDPSGGPIKQVLTDSAGQIFERYSLNTSSWGPWNRNYNGYYKPRLGADLLSSGGNFLTDANTITSNGTAAYIAGQSAWATFGTSTSVVQKLRSDGALAIGSGAGLATEGYGQWITNALVITSQGTAQYLSGQSAWATYGGLNPTNVANQVQYLQTDGHLQAQRVYDPDGLGNLYAKFPGERGANVTESRTASNILNQGGFATQSRLNLDNGSFFEQPQRFLGMRNGDGRWFRADVVMFDANDGYGGGYQTLNSLRPGELGANITENRRAAYISGQSSWATYSGLNPNNVAGQISRLNPTDGRIADPRVYNTQLLLGPSSTTNLSPGYTVEASYVTVTLSSHTRYITGPNGPIGLNYGQVSGSVNFSTYWTAYLDDPALTGNGSPSVGFTSDPNQLLYPGRYQIASGFTPNQNNDGGGVGGGGGGGGWENCVGVGMLVETRDRGWLRADQIVAGDWLRVLDQVDGVTGNVTGASWAVCTGNFFAISPGVRVTTLDGRELELSQTTPMTLMSGDVLNVMECDGLALPVNDGDRVAESTATIEELGDIEVAHISVSNGTYLAAKVPGYGIYSHNIYYKP